MSTFLEICQDVAREGGLAGSGPSTVTGQTGDHGRIVNWVAQAWSEIQRKHDNWLWMNATFSFDTVEDQWQYTTTEVLGASPRFRAYKWEHVRMYLKTSGENDEQILYYLPWPQFVQAYRIGPKISGRPLYASISPDKKMSFGPMPNGIYTCLGEYQKSAQVLAADSDTPELPSEYHDLIMHRALMRYGAFEAASEVYDEAKNMFKAMLNDLEREQLPAVYLAGPMV